MSQPCSSSTSGRACFSALLPIAPRRHAVYASFALKERVDAGYGFQRDWCYLVGRFALAHVAGDIGQFKELAPRMAPAECASDRRRAAAGTIEIVVAAIGIGLKDAMQDHGVRQSEGEG